MSWEDIMRRVLPPIGGLSPGITKAGAYGAVKGRKPPSSRPHGGVDFNYSVGQTGINLTHPEVRSPVAGTVTTNPGEGNFGRIAIRDANGLSHEVLHTDTQYVKRGDLVGVGQPIGRMGNTGTGDQHVHYQLRDSTGQAINPTDFWDRLGPAKTDPGQPAYLPEYQQYLQGLGEALSPDSPASFDSRFGNWNPSPASGYANSLSPLMRELQKYKRSAAPDGPASTSAQEAPPAAPALQSDREYSPGGKSGSASGKPVRILTRRFVDQPQMDIGAPAASLASSNNPDPPGSDLANWIASLAGVGPQNPTQPAPSPQDEVLRGYYRDDPTRPWFVRARRQRV